MTDRRKRKTMENLDKIYNLVRQSSTGISAATISNKLEMNRQSVHRYLNTLELMDKVRNQDGSWFPKKGSENDAPLPSKESLNRLFLERILRQIDEIKEAMYRKDSPAEAFLRFQFLIGELPPKMKKKEELSKILFDTRVIPEKELLKENLSDKTLKKIEYEIAMEGLSRIMDLLYEEFGDFKNE